MCRHLHHHRNPIFCIIPPYVLDEIAQTYQGKLKVCKLNIDENQETPQKYAVRGIPTLMMFKNGEVAGTKVGAMSKSQLSAFVDSLIEPVSKSGERR